MSLKLSDDWLAEAYGRPVRTQVGTGTFFAGTSDADTYTGTSGSDTLNGVGNNDTLSGEAGADLLYGGDGNDTIDAGFSPFGGDRMFGDAGDDRIFGSLGIDTAYGGVGNDFIEAAIAYGDENNDTLQPLFGQNGTLFGGAGNDTVYGEQGNDTIHGDADDDVIYGTDDGASDNDTLYGDAGNDTIWSSSHELIFGGIGNDVIHLGHISGGSTIDGGTNVDNLDRVIYDGAFGEVVYGGGLVDTVVFLLGGMDILIGIESIEGLYGFDDGGNGNDTLDLGSGNDSVNLLDGDDTATAGAGDDVVTGGEGADLIYGGLGNDVLSTAAANDLIPEDVSYGGQGNDHFLVDIFDRIRDFGFGDLITLQLDFQPELTRIYDFGREIWLRFWDEDTQSYELFEVETEEEAAPRGFTTWVDENGNRTIEYDDEPEEDEPEDVVDDVEAADAEFAGVSQAFQAHVSPLINELVAQLGDEESPIRETVQDFVAGDVGVAIAELLFSRFNKVAIAAGTFRNQAATAVFEASIIEITLKNIRGEYPDQRELYTDYLLTGVGELIEVESDAAKLAVSFGLNYYKPIFVDMVGRIQQAVPKFLLGTAGDDEEFGTDDNEIFYSGDGEDVDYGGGGDDWLKGGSGAGNDAYYGGGGFDFVDYNSSTLGIVVDLAAQTASGQEIHSDVVAEIEAVAGGQGNDRIVGDGSENALYGNDGDDRIEGGAGNDRLTGGAGGDVVVGGDGNDTSYGSAGADLLIGDLRDGTGASGNDVLYGGDGADYVDAGAGNDTLDLGAGSDWSNGGAGDQTVLGGPGVDVIFGGAGNDLIDGGDDAGDALLGGAGNDTIYGGAGSPGADWIDGDGGDSSGLPGDDLLYGGDGSDVVFGGGGVDRTYGGAGDDQLQGGGAADTLFGGDGKDRVFGGDGNDVLDGGAGNDFIDGGLGHDVVAYAGAVTVVGAAGGVRTVNAGIDGIDVLVDVEVILTPTTVLDLTFLTTSQGFVIQGDSAIDHAGRDVAAAGDVNGDGFSDIIIGAPFNSDGGIVAGAAYVIFGIAGGGGRSTIDLTSLGTEIGFVIQGDDDVDFAGVSVSSAGDVNGDGLDDLLVGANGGEGGGGNAGEAYVIFGTAGGFGVPVASGNAIRRVVDLTSLTAEQGFLVQGSEPDNAGLSVSSAGDVNGDGLDDIIVGAFAGNDGGLNAGEAYVVFGSHSPIGTTVTSGGVARQVVDVTSLVSTQGFIIQGDTALDEAGISVSSAGDINGDGYDDMIVGAGGSDGGHLAGETYVIFGGPSFGSPTEAAGFVRRVVDLTSLSSSQGFIIQGDSSDDLAAFASAAGDFNGDGFDDIVVGASGGDDGGLNAGEAYVIFGGSGPFGAMVITDGAARRVLDLTSLSPLEGFIIQGAGSLDVFGRGSGAGDVNGDGFDDLIVGGSPVNESGGASSGAAYIIFGAADGFGVEVSIAGVVREVFDVATLSGDRGFIIHGDSANDSAGASVSSAGDVNGDGFDDVIVGAEGGDEGGAGAGQAYVVYGAPSGSSTPVVQAGGAGSDVLIGSSGADTLSGGGGADVIRGGAGNDLITVSDLAFADIDGGNGIDTLRFNGIAQTLDLSLIPASRLQSIERIDVSGAGNDVLRLDDRAVFDLTEVRGANAPGLAVLGNMGDVVEIDVTAPESWGLVGSSQLAGVTFNRYQWDRDGAGSSPPMTNAELWIEQDLAVIFI